MAAPVEELPLFAYTCCEVWATEALGTPCWVCGQQDRKINCFELETFDRLRRPMYLVKQNTDNSYL